MVGLDRYPQCEVAVTSYVPFVNCYNNFLFALSSLLGTLSLSLSLYPTLLRCVIKHGIC